MVAFYYKRIIAGKKLWTEIPDLWKQDVITILLDEGYTLNENGTISK